MAAKKARKTKKAPSVKQLAARRKFALAAKARSKAAKAKAVKRPAKKTARKRNGTTIIRAKKIEHLDVSKIHSLGAVPNLKSNPSFAIHKTLKPAKRGNQAGWLLGKKFYAKARGQKALPGNSILDLNSGLVYQRVANPKMSKTQEWEKAWGDYIKALQDMDKPSKGANARAAAMRLGKAQKRLQQLDPDFYRRVVLKQNPKKKNIAGFMQDGVFHPIRSGIEKRTTKAKGTRYVKSKKKYKPSAVKEKYTYSPKKSAKRAAQSRRMAAATKQRKATTSRLASRSLQRSVPLKGKRRNPDTPAQLLNEFRGYPKDKDSTLYFAEGTPTGLYKLGSLYQIKLVNGTKIKPKAGKVWLCADTKGKLYLGTTDSKQVLAHAPQGSLGKVSQVEYVARKPHLGDNQVTRYYHNLGEETGEKPSLYSDGKGGLLFKGGATYIRSDGIHN